MAYLDAASAEPMSAAAIQALLAALDDGWADPARLHREGRRAAMLLDQARERVAGVVRCRADEVAFTSSGTQAVHLAVLGAVLARQSASRGPGHVVVSAVEHSSVLNAAAQAEQAGSQVTIVAVGTDGRVDVSGFTEAVRTDRTVLACLQSANHEVGTIQPVEEVSAECQAHRVPLLVDAAASAGRAPLPTGWSMLATSGHKWGGPPGVGVMVIRKTVRWRAPMPAGNREGHRVPGFPNLPAIISAVTALEAFEAGRDEADKAGFSVSSGSSCATETQQPSNVLAAMGAITHGNVRVSLPRGTSAETVTKFLEVLPQIASRLRGSAGQSRKAG